MGKSKGLTDLQNRIGYKVQPVPYTKGCNTRRLKRKLLMKYRKHLTEKQYKYLYDLDLIVLHTLVKDDSINDIKKIFE